MEKDFLESLMQPEFQDGITTTIADDPHLDQMNYSRDKMKNGKKLSKGLDKARKSTKGKRNEPTKR